MAKRSNSKKLDTQKLAEQVIQCDRAALGRAITLIESTRTDHQEQAQELLEHLLPHTGNSIRIGISGVPGVGKSTFIESFGLNLIEDGKKVAVLAVDPTSERTGGSILGDKTRMNNLSVNKSAFIRPSPTSGVLGGVNRLTRESILVCEAAGFDTILVETVGVGQSETVVASMVDFFLVLMLPGAGDDLQGIKRGVMEVADMLVINKADGNNESLATSARNDYSHALKLLTPEDAAWCPPVLTCSALLNQGLDQIWQKILSFRDIQTNNGQFRNKRQLQLQNWLDSTLEQLLMSNFHNNQAVQDARKLINAKIADGSITPANAAHKLLAVHKNNQNTADE